MLPSYEGQETMTEAPKLPPDTLQAPPGRTPDTGDLAPIYDGGGVPFVDAVVDKRRREFRHYRQAVADYCADCGGADGMSRMELDIARRLAGVNTLCDKLEAAIVAGEEINIGEYLTACNVARRLAGALGLRRRARDVTLPDPIKYAMGEE